MSFEERNDDGFRQKQRDKKEANELAREEKDAFSPSSFSYKEGRNSSYSGSNDRQTRDNRYSRDDRGRSNYDRGSRPSGRDDRNSFQSRDRGYSRDNNRDRDSRPYRDSNDRFTPRERSDRNDRFERNDNFQSRPRYDNDYKPREFSRDNSRSFGQSRFSTRDSFGTNEPYEQKQRPYATKQARNEDDFFSSPSRAPRDSFGTRNFERDRLQNNFQDRNDRPQRDFNDRPRRDFGDRPQRDFNDRPQRDFGDRPQRDFGDKPFREREGRTSRFRENSDNLFAIDKEILHLLFRRAEFLQQVKRDNRVDPTLEKKLRNSWERGAARVTRDPRIARDFFNFLQQIEPIPLVDGVPMYFNLAPVFAPSKIDMRAPVCSRQLRAFLAIAASTAANTIFQVDLSPTMMSAIKAFNQLGGQLWWEGDGKVFSRGGDGITRHIDRVIPVGEDAYTFYLALSMALLVPSRIKFVGDGALRFLSTSEIRRFLPQLNARMSVVIPGHDGIPVRAESVGMLPQAINFPYTLPADFIIALMLISVARRDVEGSLDFSIENHPEAERIMSEVLSVLDELDIPNTVEKTGKTLKISYTPVEPSMGEDLKVELEPAVATTLLAIPAFVGGKTVLHGAFNEADENYINFLKSSGLNIEIEDMTITSERKGNALLQPDYALAPSYPFALVFAALSLYNGFDVKLPEMPKDVDEDITKGFLEQIGVAVKPETSMLEKVAPSSSPWFVPSAEWGLALSLAAFIRPHIRITNPDIVSSIYPTFWKIYNTLNASAVATTSTDTQVEDDNPVRRYIVESPVVTANTEVDPEDIDEEDEFLTDEIEENLLDNIEYINQKEIDDEEE